jgi:low affinity Fe/Cu permease
MQNKDSRAIHLKLNELVASLKGPSNRLIDVESLSEQEVEMLTKYFHRLSEMAKRDRDITASHSIEEAEELHKTKYRGHQMMRQHPKRYKKRPKKKPITDANNPVKNEDKKIIP